MNDKKNPLLPLSFPFGPRLCVRDGDVCECLCAFILAGGVLLAEIVYPGNEGTTHRRVQEKKEIKEMRRGRAKKRYAGPERMGRGCGDRDKKLPSPPPSRRGSCAISFFLFCISPPSLCSILFYSLPVFVSCHPFRCYVRHGLPSHVCVLHSLVLFLCISIA